MVPTYASRMISGRLLMRQVLRRPEVQLALYGVLLALIAFWPSPVDRDAKGLITALLSVWPVMSYNTLEFVANIAMFVPLGLLLPRLIGRDLVVPAALVISTFIEVVQGLALTQRVFSVSDIVANSAGAALGLLIGVLRTRRRGRLAIDW